MSAVLERIGAQTGDLVFFGADSAKVVNTMGALRGELGSDLGVLDGDYRPCWVVDWPMFSQDRDGSFSAEHTPLRGQHVACRGIGRPCIRAGGSLRRCAERLRTRRRLAANS